MWTELLAALAAVAAVALPLLLAGWLLGRPERPRDEPARRPLPQRKRPS